MNLFLQVMAAILSFGGYYFINRKDIKGYYLFMLANVASIILSLIFGLWVQAGMFVVYMIFNIDGIIKWSKQIKEGK